MPILVHMSGPGAPRRVSLDAGLHQVGRARDCSLVLQGDRVSRVHALIEVGPDRVILVDRSLNGTWVNGQRTECAPLNEGDRIRIGQNELVIEGIAVLSQAPVPEPAPASSKISSSKLLAHKDEGSGLLTIDGGAPTPVVATATLSGFEPTTVQFRLHVSLPDGTSSQLEVGNGPIRIGSDPSCEVRSPDRGFPPLHATIARERGVLVIQAYGDPQSVLVNGKPASRRVVMPGDVVRVGGCQLTIELLR